MKPKQNIRRLLWISLPVWLAPLILLGPGLVSGRVLFWGTPALQFTAWWWAAWEQIRAGSLPLWNPLNGMGAPLLANYQSAFLYPPNWLLLPLAAVGGPGGIAWGYTLLAMLHLVWAGLGMTTLLRRLGFGWLGQVVGGLVFGLAGYVVGRLGFFSMTWAAAWLPWVIYFTSEMAHPGMERGQEPGRVRLSPGLTLSVALLLLAGHAQLAWYSLLLAGAWVLVGALGAGGWRFLLRRGLSFGLSLAVAAMIAGAQLGPTFEYLLQSQRGDAVQYEEAMRYSMWPWRALTLFSPDFFGSPGRGDYWGFASFWEDHAYTGMLPLLLALATLPVLFAFRRKVQHRGLVVFLWTLTGVTLVLALGQNTPVFPFLYKHVPSFDMFQAPARYLLWLAFAVPLLAAVGIERWRCPIGRGLYWFRLSTAGAFAVTLGAVLATMLLSDVRLTFIRATALSGVWALGVGLLTLAIPLVEKRGWQAHWRAAVVGWVMLDLLAAAWLLNPLVRVDFYRAESAGADRASAAVDGHRLYLGSREEYDLKFDRFLRFRSFLALEDWRGMRAALLPNLNLLEGIASANNFDPLVPGRYARWMAELETQPPDVRERWLALMDVGAVEHIDVSQPGGVRFDPLDGAQRARWYPCVLPAAGADEALAITTATLADGDSGSPVVVVEGWDQPPPPSCGPSSVDGALDIRILEDRPTRVALEVTAPEDGWLLLADTYDPGWRATLDGDETRVYPAYTLFRAVTMAAGRHEVVFEYRPVGFIIGVGNSILGLLLIWQFGRRAGRGKQRVTGEMQPET